MKKLNFLNIKGSKLNREEMANIMAGSGGGCYEGSSNSDFCAQTGCEASFDNPSDTCVGNNGKCTYNAAHRC